MTLPTNRARLGTVDASDINAIAAQVNLHDTSKVETTAMANYYTKAQVDAAIAAAVASLQPQPPPNPTTPYSPANILNDGLAAGQNHFAVQVAPTGASAYVLHTINDIADGYAENPYFYVTSDNFVHFQARVDGPTTSGSNYARCELRELMPDGSNAAINVRTGTHRLANVTRITHLMANKPEIVIAQLHDGNHDRIAIRTQANAQGVNVLSIRINGSVGDKTGANGNGWQESVAYTLNRQFAWKIEGVNDVWKIYIDDMTTPKVTVPAGGLSSSSTAWYFKTGCYLQSQLTVDDVGTEYGAVEHGAQLIHWHTNWTPNLPYPTLP